MTYLDPHLPVMRRAASMPGTARGHSTYRPLVAARSISTPAFFISISTRGFQAGSAKVVPLGHIFLIRFLKLRADFG